MPNNLMKSDAADDKLIEVGDLRINSRDRSIEVHIHRLRSKLGVRGDGRPLIQTIHKQGFQFLVS